MANSAPDKRRVLLERLRQLKRFEDGTEAPPRQWYDAEDIHRAADVALLAYIGDPEIDEAFDDLTRWYA